MFEISKQMKRIFYSLLVLSDGPVSIKNNIRSLSFHKYKKNKCSGCCHNIQIKLSFLILKALLWKGPEFIFIVLKIFFQINFQRSLLLYMYIDLLWWSAL